MRNLFHSSNENDGQEFSFSFYRRSKRPTLSNKFSSVSSVKLKIEI